MNKLGNYLYAGSGLIVVLGAITLVTAGPVKSTSTAPVPVTITNGNAQPVPNRDQDNPAQQPVQFSLLPHSSTLGTNATYFNVPTGKRLVIDYYSAQAQDLSGGAVGLTLGTTAGGSSASYIVFVNKNDTNAINQQAKIYADPGTAVQAFVFNGGGAHSCGSLITVSGHYVNIP